MVQFCRSFTRRILFVLRNHRVHVIPWLRVGCEDVHLRTKPTWVIETASEDANDPRWLVLLFGACDPRAALRAKAAFVLAARQARCEMITQLPFFQLERLSQQQNGCSKPDTRDLLAIHAMALEHHNRFSLAFVA